MTLADPLPVLRAALTWLVENLPHSQTNRVETVCLSLYPEGIHHGREREIQGSEKDGLDSFLSHNLGLCVIQRDQIDTRGRTFLAADTGEPAAHLRICLPTFLDAEVAEVDLGYHRGSLWGRGFRCTLAGGEAGWKVMKLRRTWAS